MPHVSPGPYKESHNLSLNALRRTTRRIIRSTTPLILTLLPVSTNNITAATRIAVVQVQLTAVGRIPIAVTEAVEAGESARSLHAGERRVRSTRALVIHRAAMIDVRHEVHFAAIVRIAIHIRKTGQTGELTVTGPATHRRIRLWLTCLIAGTAVVNARPDVRLAEFPGVPSAAVIPQQTHGAAATLVAHGILDVITAWTRIAAVAAVVDVVHDIKTGLRVRVAPLEPGLAFVCAGSANARDVIPLRSVIDAVAIPIEAG